MEKRKSGVQKKIVKKDRKFLKQALDYLASDTYMYAPLIACSLHSSTFTPSSPSTEKEVPVRQLQISRIADDQMNRRATANLKFVLAQLGTENVEAAPHILQRLHDPRTNGQTLVNCLHGVAFYVWAWAFILGFITICVLCSRGRG